MNKEDRRGASCDLKQVFCQTALCKKAQLLSTEQGSVDVLENRQEATYCPVTHCR